MKLLFPVVAASALACALGAQAIQPPFQTSYTYTDLGSVANVPGPYGGVVFQRNDPSKLLISGGANSVNGAIYEVSVSRDSAGRVNGIGTNATVVAYAPEIDGGLAFAPNGVLMYTTYPTNQLCEILPGHTTASRTIALGPLGVGVSTGTLTFVPAGFPGAGQLKIASYDQSTVHGFTIAPDAQGTYGLTAVNGPAQVVGNPEGLLYCPPGSSQIPDWSYMIVSEYGSGDVALYHVDAVGNPQIATRQVLMNGLLGACGACTDPISGDLVFVTFGGGDRVVTLHGFGICGSWSTYGTGIQGLHGAPVIQGGGCAGRGQFTSVNVSNGRAAATGLLAVGFDQASTPILNGDLLVQIVSTWFHVLDAGGQWSLQLYLPQAPVWNGLNIYTQAFYLDAAGAAGVAATNGLHITVR